jgi:Family of unknown function (DUF5675)
MTTPHAPILPSGSPNFHPHPSLAPQGEGAKPPVVTTTVSIPTPLRLAIYRDHEACTESFTPGALWVDGVRFCCTLEDAIRDAKVHGETAIPTGEYAVDITWSPKFKRRMPLLLNVKNFTGIRIHFGNTVADTQGCPLVGMACSEDKSTLKASRQAFDKLFAVLEKALAAGRAIELVIR